MSLFVSYANNCHADCYAKESREEFTTEGTERNMEFHGGRISITNNNSVELCVLLRG